MKPEDVLAFFGTPRKFHRATGMSCTTLYNWLNSGFVPESAQGRLQGLTGGQLKAVFNVEKTERAMKQFSYYLTPDKEVKPCDVSKWAAQYEQLASSSNIFVANELLRGYHIITVWIGIDYLYGFGERKPLLFETLIFSPGESDESYCARFSTWQEAEEGHLAAKQWLINKLEKDSK